MTTDFPAPAAAPLPRGNDKIWAILSHLSTFLGIGFIQIGRAHV